VPVACASLPPSCTGVTAFEACDIVFMSWPDIAMASWLRGTRDEGPRSVPSVSAADAAGAELAQAGRFSKTRPATARGKRVFRFIVTLLLLRAEGAAAIIMEIHVLWKFMLTKGARPIDGQRRPYPRRPAAGFALGDASGWAGIRPDRAARERCQSFPIDRLRLVEGHRSRKERRRQIRDCDVGAETAGHAAAAMVIVIMML
jgi:hypothetical protein